MDFQDRLHKDAWCLLLGKGALPESASLPNPDGPSSPNDVKVTFGRYELWIYEDGANILGPSIDQRFEEPDFANLEELHQAVLVFLERLLPV